MMDDVLDQASSVYGRLVNQNSTLKGAKKKMLDVASVLGLSSSLVGSIERRHQTDKYIVYALMAFTLFLIFGLYKLIL